MVGKPFAFVDVDADGVNGPGPVRALEEDTELRAAPVSEPFAEAVETEEGREMPETEGHTLRSPVVLGFRLAAALRASHADCRVAGRLGGEVGETCVGPLLPVEDLGPLLRQAVLTLAGGGGAARLLREAAALLVLVVRDLATLAPPSEFSSSSDPATELHAGRIELAFDCVSARSTFQGTVQSSGPGGGGALES
jgi:hypothetical protein